MISGSSLATGLRRRLLRGFGATALGPVITAAIQLGAVPLLLHAWGAAKYGEWLVLSAIPTYFGLSDLGFGDASGSDMTVRVAGGDRAGAVCTFQSSWVLLTTVSGIAFLLASAVVWWLPWTHWLHIASLSNNEAAIVFLVFGAYVMAGQQTGILESGFRCDGNYSIGTLYGNLLRLLETAGATLIGVLTGNFIAVAFTYFCVRSAGTICYGMSLKHKSPWIRFGFREAKWNRVKQLSKPAFGFVVLPAANGLSLQGFTILIGGALGPIAVTMFSTLRTLTRINYQFLSTIAFTIWPELSAAFGAGNLRLARDLHRNAYRIGLAASFITSLGLWIAGPFLYRIWMRNAVPFNAQCFHILILVTIASSLWYLSSIVLMSTNAHHRIALIYFGLAAASLGVAYMLVRPFGIVGAALALLLIDAGMCALVLRKALNQLGDSFHDFVMAVFELPNRLSWTGLSGERLSSAKLQKGLASPAEE